MYAPGGWNQPYSYYNNTGYGGYLYNQQPRYGYPPPEGASLYGYQQPPPRPNPSHMMSYYPPPPPSFPQQQVNMAPALTFDGMSSEDMQQAQQEEKQRLFQFVKLSAFEESRYDELWRKASKGSPTVKGKSARDFLEHAVGLQRPTLKKIWSIADVNHRGELDRQEFFIALRLIAISQRGSDPSVYSLQRFSGMQLIPEFKWEADNEEHVSQQRRTSPQTGQKDDDSFKISEEQRAYYDQTFSELDWAHSGYISFSQAFDYFSQSGMADHLIQRILKLSDISGDERLDKFEFRVAAHLYLFASNGDQLPSELPYSLAMELNKGSSSERPSNEYPNHTSQDPETLRSHIADAKLQTEQTKRKVKEIQEKMARLRSEKKVLQDQIKSYDTEIQQIRSQLSDEQANYYVETSFFPNETESRRMDGGDKISNKKSINKGTESLPSSEPTTEDLPPPPSYDEIVGSASPPTNSQGKSASPPTSDKSGKGGHFSMFSNVFSRRASEKKNQ